MLATCADPAGEHGAPTPPPPLKNHKNIGFLSNIGPDPEKSQSYQTSFQCLDNIDTPAKRHFNGVSLTGPMMAHLDPLFLHQNTNNKKRSKLDPLRQNFLDPRMS